MAKNTYHGEPLQFVSLTPAAMPAAAKVAKVKVQSAAPSPWAKGAIEMAHWRSTAGRSCGEQGTCQRYKTRLGACTSCESKAEQAATKKAEAQAAAADAAEAAYQAGIHAFLAGAAQAANPHLPADAMHWAWQEGWLDAQAYHGHPPANTPSHADLGRSHIASAMLYVLAGAVLLGVMVWHSARVDGKLAASPTAQSEGDKQ